MSKTIVKLIVFENRFRATLVSPFINEYAIKIVYTPKIVSRTKVLKQKNGFVEYFFVFLPFSVTVVGKSKNVSGKVPTEYNLLPEINTHVKIRRAAHEKVFTDNKKKRTHHCKTNTFFVQNLKDYTKTLISSRVC